MDQVEKIEIEIMLSYFCHYMGFSCKIERCYVNYNFFKMGVFNVGKAIWTKPLENKHPALLVELFYQVCSTT